MKYTDEQKAVIQGVTQIYGVPEKLLIPIADNVLKLLNELQPVNPWPQKDVPTYGGISSGDKMLTEKAVNKSDGEMASKLEGKMRKLWEKGFGFHDIAVKILSILPRREADRELIATLKWIKNKLQDDNLYIPTASIYTMIDKVIRNADTK